MSLAADDRAHNLIFPWFGRDAQDKFLVAGLEFEVPVRDFRAILLADESETVNGSVPVEGLCLLGSDTELYFFARLEGKRGTHLAADLVAAVFIGQDFNHAHRGLGGAWRNESCGQKSEQQRGNTEGGSGVIELHDYSVM